MEEGYNEISEKLNPTNKIFLERMCKEVNGRETFLTKEEQTKYCRGMYSNVHV